MYSCLTQQSEQNSWQLQRKVDMNHLICEDGTIISYSDDEYDAMNEMGKRLFGVRLDEYLLKVRQGWYIQFIDSREVYLCDVVDLTQRTVTVIIMNDNLRVSTRLLSDVKLIERGNCHG